MFASMIGSALYHNQITPQDVDLLTEWAYTNFSPLENIPWGEKAKL